MKLTEIISETPKQITWGTFYWAPYDYSTYFEHSEGQLSSFLLSIFLDLGLGYQCHFSWGLLMTCAVFMGGSLEIGLWLTWETVLIAGERWKENINRKKYNNATLGEASTGWHQLPSYSPESEWLSHLRRTCHGLPRRAKNNAGTGLQRGSIYIPS